MKEYKRHLVSSSEIGIPEGEMLLINLRSNKGIETIRVFVENGKTTVLVSSWGGASSYYEDKRTGKSKLPKFVLENPDERDLLKDLLRDRFYSQFNFGELVDLHNNKKFEKRLNAKIEKVLSQFESLAAGELNSLPGVPERVKIKREKQSPKR